MSRLRSVAVPLKASGHEVVGSSLSGAVCPITYFLQLCLAVLGAGREKSSWIHPRLKLLPNPGDKKNKAAKEVRLVARVLLKLRIMESKQDQK